MNSGRGSLFISVILFAALEICTKSDQNTLREKRGVLGAQSRGRREEKDLENRSLELVEVSDWQHSHTEPEWSSGAAQAFQEISEIKNRFEELAKASKDKDSKIEQLSQQITRLEKLGAHQGQQISELTSIVESLLLREYQNTSLLLN